MDLLRDLLKTPSIEEGFMPDFNSMSDDELKSLCMELECEDLCELDDEGNITNREALIRDLESGHGGGDIDTPMEPADEQPMEAAIPVIKHRGKPMTNVRKKMNYFKPLKESEAVNIVNDISKLYKPVKESVPVVKFKQKADGGKKPALPAHGGYQKDVKNKSAAQAIEDEVGDAGMKGMKKKDRPYMEKPRFRDWLTANMYFNMTKSGELAGTMKLGETEESKESKQDKYEVFGYYEARQDGKNYRRTFTASSPEEAKEKALKNLHGMAARAANRISKKSIKIKSVEKVG
jgi:ribosomal protein L20A (L18A)